ncbi:MAG: hypothetical protein ABEJ30_00145 [Halorientalis sp.]
MSRLTEFDGEDYEASDEEIEQAVEEAAEDLGMDPAKVHEEVAYILDSGSGTVNNEGVGGAAATANADTQSDPRLEALEVFKFRQEI